MFPRLLSVSKVAPVSRRKLHGVGCILYVWCSFIATFYMKPTVSKSARSTDVERVSVASICEMEFVQTVSLTKRDCACK